MDGTRCGARGRCLPATAALVTTSAPVTTTVTATVTTVPTAPPVDSLDLSELLQEYRPSMRRLLNGDTWANSPSGGCCEQLTIHVGSRKPTKAELDALWAGVEQELLDEMRDAAMRSESTTVVDAPATALSGGIARPLAPGTEPPARRSQTGVARVSSPSAGVAGFMARGSGSAAELVVDVRGLRGAVWVRAVRGLAELGRGTVGNYREATATRTRGGGP